MTSRLGITRRKAMFGMATLATVGFGGAIAQEQREIDSLKPGEFTWHPDRQPFGAVSIVVSLPQQLVHVYRNAVRIAVSTCSAGKPGHSTPRGVFVVLQKDKHHHSSTYNNAPMPNMNRLTWSGIALHAGDLPGYPASHGCVRLPLEFSELLFEISHLGKPVIIANDHDDPWELTHPGLVLAPAAEDTMEAAEIALGGKSGADDWLNAWNHPVTSIVVSSADSKVMLIESGLIIAEVAASIRGGTGLGSNVFVLQGLAEGAGMVWHAITHSAEGWLTDGPDDQILARVTTEDAFRDLMVRHMHPGMVYVTTDLPLHPDMRSGTDFVIMS